MSEWATVALGDAIDFFDSKRIPLSAIERAKRRGEFPYYGASGIIDWIDDYIFDGRYLLVAEDGENLNSRKLPVAFFAEGKFWVNNHAHIVRGKSDVLDDVFLQQWLLHADIGGYITGSAQPKLSQANMKRIQVGLPPLPTQRKIAAFLSGYDALIDNNKRRIKLLEEMAERIYREWFVDFRFPGHRNIPLVDSELGPIPQGWYPRTLGESCSLIQSGGTPSRANPAYWRDGTVDWFTTTELQDGFLLGSSERITALALKDRKTRVFPAGAILMAIYGSPTVGRLGVLNQPGACNQAALAMVAHAVPQVLLYYALLGLRAHFNSIAQGAAQQNISKQKVAETLIVCPPPALCRSAEELLAPLWEQRRVLELSSSLLRSSRDMLLPDLISGEIDVADLDIVLPEAAA